MARKLIVENCDISNKEKEKRNRLFVLDVDEVL